MSSSLHLVRQRDYLYVRGLLPDKKEIIPSVGVPTGARLVNQWIATGYKVGEETGAESVLEEVSIDLQKWEWGIPFPWDKWAKRSRSSNRNRKKEEEKRKDKETPPPLSSSYESPFALGATLASLPTLNEGWELYLSRNKELSQQTILVKKIAVSPILSMFGEHPITPVLPFSIYQWLQKEFSPTAIPYRFTQLSLITDLLWEQGLLSDNPFREAVWMKEDGSLVKKPRMERRRRKSLSFFTEEERSLLLEQFPTIEEFDPGSRNNDVLFGLFCRFCFLTGCRLGEAGALTWDCIREVSTTKQILFNKVIAATENKLQMQDGLKSQEYRVFPVNAQLRELLFLLQEYRRLLGQYYNLDIKDPAPVRRAQDWNLFTTTHPIEKDLRDKEVGSRKLELVFPVFTRKRFYFNLKTYHLHWKEKLESANLSYRKPYSTRHTFISSCLEKGIPVNDIAKWVGNSPTVIYKNYASSLIAKEVPLL